MRVRRFQLLALLTLLAASCGPKSGPGPIANSAAEGPKNTLATNPPQAETWSRFRLADDGISIEMPGRPREGGTVEWKNGQVERETHFLEFASKQGPIYTFERTRYQPRTAAGPSDEWLSGALRTSMSKVEQDGPIARAGLAGHSIDGVDAKGERLSVRAYFAGNDLYVLTVTSPPEAFDPTLAAHFFDTLEVNPPLYAYASSEGHFTVSLPVFFHEMSGKARPVPSGGVLRAFALGSGPETALVVFATPIANPNVSPDDLLTSMVLAPKGSMQKLKNIAMNGAPGRDYVMRTKDGLYIHGRNFVVGSTAYIIQFSSPTEEPVTGELAGRILDSFRWAAP